MRYASLLLSMLLLVGCTNQQNNDQSGQSESTGETERLNLGAPTIEQAAEKHFRYVTGATDGEVVDTAYRQYVLDHSNEMNRTFEVSHVDSVRNYGSALYLFSIGGDIYRESYDMLKYDGLWYQSRVYMDSDELADLPSEVVRRYEEMEEKSDEWVENSPPILSEEEFLK